MTKTIAVIDGNSLMHRAYHAVQTPMTANDGTPTNAVFGFMQMLCKFIEMAHPDAIVCAFDAGKPQFRIEELPGYKAHRPSMDDELRVQFPVIEQLLEAMNVPVIKVPGWEGDDILGTIAARDEKLGFTTLLVTGDKDACQLATPLTRIVTTKKGITDVVIYGPDEVFEKYGVTPQQFCDFLGLMGDSSDNIPGVAGIGPKNATKLLEQYGTIEGIYEHISELKGKQKENLEASKELAFLSRQIATIVCDLDFELDLEGISFPSFTAKEVEDAFGQYQLKAPLARVLTFINTKASTQTLSLEIGTCTTNWEELLSKGQENNELVGVALSKSEEATIFGNDYRVALSLEGSSVYLEGVEVIEALVSLFSSCRFAVLDLKELMQVIYQPDTSETAEITDEVLFNHRGNSISLIAYALESTKNAYTYEGLAERFFDASLPEVDSPNGSLVQKAALCRMLYPVMIESLERDHSASVYEDIDLPLVSVLAQMERTGVRLDLDRLKELAASTQEKLTDLSQTIYNLAGEEFNIDSPKQLGHILFEVLEIPPLKKNSRGYSTDASVLKELAKTYEIAQDVLKYRELAKLKSTYLDSLPRMRASDGLVHTVFHETVTATGRLSSSDPNLQNIPVRTEYGKQIRECFVPLDDESVFLSADYSQIELRLLAHLSNDQHLIEAFNGGADFHATTAAHVHGIDVAEVTQQMRSAAKAVNFGIVYGQQAFGLSHVLDIPVSEAADMIQRYFEAYPQVRSYLDNVIAQSSESGFAETMFDRKRRIPELKASNKNVRSLGERTAMNHPMQGAAADIIKLAMIEVSQRMRQEALSSRMILQIHDELDFSVPRSEVEIMSSLVKEVMESVISLQVPLLVDVSWGANWAEAH